VFTRRSKALLSPSTASASWSSRSPRLGIGNIELFADGGFSPKTLSKTELTPIAFTAEGKIKTLDGTHPPALKEVLLEADKNTAVNVKGYPTCESSQLQAQDTAHAEDTCRSAIIGNGKAKAVIAFPESGDVPVSTKLLVFNGGESLDRVDLGTRIASSRAEPARAVPTVTSLKGLCCWCYFKASAKQ
jgi:hypothetical protein